jgi:hypothetical protein
VSVRFAHFPHSSETYITPNQIGKKGFSVETKARLLRSVQRLGELLAADADVTVGLTAAEMREFSAIRLSVDSAARCVGLYVCMIGCMGVWVCVWCVCVIETGSEKHRQGDIERERKRARERATQTNINISEIFIHSLASGLCFLFAIRNLKRQWLTWWKRRG